MLGKEIIDIKLNGWIMFNRDFLVIKIVQEGKILIKLVLFEVIISLYIVNYFIYKKLSYRSINSKLNLRYFG